MRYRVLLGVAIAATAMPAVFSCGGDETKTCPSCGGGGTGGDTGGEAPAPACSDGAIDAEEQCDDGNAADADGCDARCAVEVGYSCIGAPSVCSATCGDGAIAAPVEACDDANANTDDGCDTACAVETGWTCDGSPSACTATCGDGLLRGPEVCDDGGTATADGCDASCQVETGYECEGEPSVCLPAMLAADGKAGLAGNLYRVDVTDGSTEVIGPIGYAITGLAFAPDGTLYGSQATQSGNKGEASLIQINISTGEGTPVGLMTDPGTTTNHASTADLTFAGTTLIGWSEFGDDPITIDTSTGAVSVIGDSGVSSAGSGISTDAAGTVWFVPGRVNGDLLTIDTSTGVGTTVVTLNGGTYDNLNSLTWHRGTLYAGETQDLGSASSLIQLVTIDTTTGTITPIGMLPTGVDAIASPRPAP